MQHAVTKVVSLAIVADLLIDSVEQGSVDAGSIKVSKVIHPTCGLLTVITNSFDENCVVLVAPEFAMYLPA